MDRPEAGHGKNPIRPRFVLAAIPVLQQGSCETVCPHVTLSALPTLSDPLQTQKVLVRGEHISVIASISLQGILTLQIVRGTVDADVYYTFAFITLLLANICYPNLMGKMSIAWLFRTTVPYTKCKK